ATAAAVALHLAPVLGHRGRATGDGRNVDSYGFALRPASVGAERIVASGLPKDGLPALTEPLTWTVARADAETRGRRKFLVPSDLVIGVDSNGEARAYPLRLLVWHEVVNDTIAGVPVVVIYSPLSDTAAVFERRIGNNTLTFGFSGLLLNSSTLIFDRQPDPPSESLWSPLAMRAVAGPAAGTALVLLPCTVTSWGAWRAAHPGGRVLAPDPRLRANYKRSPYSSYFGSDRLRFPVEPLPPPGPLARKARVVAFPIAPGRYAAVPWETVLARTGGDGEWDVEIEGTHVRLGVGGVPPGVSLASPAGDPLAAVFTAHFAWYAFHHADTLWLDD
ncbi:MAG: DUF3179 domain-containing (seleno)protein, partial [Acidobacteriota bacterium]